MTANPSIGSGYGTEAVPDLNSQIAIAFGGQAPVVASDLGQVADPEGHDVNLEGWAADPDIPGPASPAALPVHMLPEVLQAQVLSVSGSMQVPSDLPFMLALASLSVAAGGRVEVEVRPGWHESVVIYTGCIMPPATRKSPTFKAMMAPVSAWEAAAIEAAAPAVAHACDQVAIHEARLEAALKAAVEDGNVAGVRAAREALIVAQTSVPANGRVIAQDVTSEKMAGLMADQGGRLAILSPEPGPLQVLNGRYSTKPQLGELAQAWCGETIIVDRVGRDPVRVERPALTMAICMQPGVLEAMSAHGAWRHEGILARFLWIMPPHGLGCRLTGSSVPSPDPFAEHGYYQLISRLMDTLFVSDTVHTLTLSPEAIRVLDSEEARVELELADDGEYEEIRDWAGKMVGQAVRIAALLSLARRASVDGSLFGPIDGDSMSAGVSIMRSLSTHAKRVLIGSSVDGRTADLQYLLRRLQDLPSPKTVTALKQATKGRKTIMGKSDVVEDLLEDLRSRGCLRLRSTPPTGGRPSSDVIEMHPMLCGGSEHEVII